MATDFIIVDHGTIWTFTPLTEAANEHCSTRFIDPAMQWGNGYAVEHRYAPDIIDDIVAEGFEIAY